jgi:hypothetical protein
LGRIKKRKSSSTAIHLTTAEIRGSKSVRHYPEINVRNPKCDSGEPP